ncbi:MAG: hypothetical protein KGL18_04005 [Burkholderiales bacterium]|nr:hypothetical protein [Burkholderiales bacterium]MDE2502130.1 hypothetical protein [Burkholderiales bacterium]
MRLQLPQITLVAIDTRAPALAAQALRRSMAQADFGRVLLFAGAAAAPGDGIETVTIAPLRSGADYSRFVLRELPDHVQTSHVLVTQWDGFVVDAAAWSDEFLAWDYIGAVWPEQPASISVGNGGFSLRSQRLLAAGRDPRLVDLHPEDQVLCRERRDFLQREHGLRWAPPALARRFAFENEAPRGATFGFHGPYNLPRFVDEATLEQWLDALPDDFFRGRDARRLARALLARRMTATAQRLLERRRGAGLADGKTRLLAATAALLARLGR